MSERRAARRKSFPAGPKGNWVSGMIPAFRDKPLDVLVEIHRTYGDVTSFRMGPTRFYMFSDPAAIHEILIEKAGSFHKSPAFKRHARDMIGNGLLTSEDDFHRRQRKLVQPAFHTSRIAAYADVMVEHTGRMLQNWETGRTYDISHEMMALTLSIVTKTLFDADASDDADAIGRAITLDMQRFNSQVSHPLRVPGWVPTPANIEWHTAVALMEQTISHIINARRKSGEDKGDLLSMLLMAVDEDDGGTMTTQQVRDEATTLFIAGHETTSNALSWTWYLLSQHPEVAAKLHDELDRVLVGRKPTMQDLPNLPYNLMVIKESMRLYPPAWVITRQAIEPVAVGGVEVAKRAVVMASPYLVHRDPRYFGEPERFRPDRWTGDFEKRIPHYAYFPFGGGPRVCIGQSFAMMEAQLVLATMAQHWHLSLLPDKEVVPEPLITLRPRNGIWMKATLRERAPALA